jgi:hypothetical protein
MITLEDLAVLRADISSAELVREITYSDWQELGQAIDTLELYLNGTLQMRVIAFRDSYPEASLPESVAVEESEN